MEEEVVKEPELDYHYPAAFRIGQRVKVVKKVSAAHTWYGEWTNQNQMVGKAFTVKQLDTMLGFFVADKTWAAWMPSSALELVGLETTIEVPATSEATSKKTPARAAVGKKVRVQKPGPWDAAPCTHLKWHLMGFFKEKLRMSVTRVDTGDGTIPSGLGEVDVQFACTKCGTSIKMKAPLAVK